MKVVSILIAIFSGIALVESIVASLIFGEMFYYGGLGYFRFFMSIVIQILFIIFFIQFALNGDTKVVKSTKKVKSNDKIDTSTDEGAGGIKWLCFFFPLIGLILYLVWQKDKPLSAKECGKFALIGFIVGLVIGLMGFIVSMAVVGSMF